MSQGESEEMRLERVYVCQVIWGPCRNSASDNHHHHKTEKKKRKLGSLRDLGLTNWAQDISVRFELCAKSRA